MKLSPRWLPVGRLFMVSWLFLLVPLVRDIVVLHAVPGDPILGLTEIAGIAGLYTWFWLRLVGTGRPLASSIAVVGATILVTLLVLPAPRINEGWIFSYAVYMAGAAFRWKRSVVAVLLVSALGALLDLAYRLQLGYIIGLRASMILQGLAVVAVGLLIGAYRELRAAREEIARLAVSEERLRFARDLHDLLGQSLTMVVLKSELAVRALPGEASASARQEIKDVAQIARRALAEVRHAVAGYRRPTLEGELGSARAALQDAGVGVAIENSLGNMPAGHDTVLAWALREGVTNVVRHSAASRCTIQLACQNGDVVLDITDNGSGGARPVQWGNGLHGLQERVRVLGGQVGAGPLPDGQFRLRVAIPVAPQPASLTAVSS